MRLSVALCFAGVFGALAAVFVLVSFGTDYWLLAQETCDPNSTDSIKAKDGVRMTPTTTFYHEGFFWRCSFPAKVKENSLLVFWLGQAESKVCSQAYLFPFPLSSEVHNGTYHDSAIIYRGFWSVFMLIGVLAVLIGGFVIICAAPFASYRLFKAGGGLFLTSGAFLLCVVVMYVLWIQVVGGVDDYVKQKAVICPKFTLSLSYGLSFMLAPVGIIFCLLTGLLFLLIGRSVQIHSK